MPQDIIRIRRDSYANWFAENPTLALGEISYDLTNNRIKVGDGATLWQSLQAIGNSTLANGDYGDIVVSNSGTAMNLDSALMTIINNKITQGPLDGGSPGTAGQVLNIRRGNTGSWSGVVLSAGEIGYDTTTSELKVGDGTTAWGSLATIGATASVNNLNALTDVTITGTPASQQALLYNSGTSQWTNQAIPTPIFPLDTLSDVTITSPANTQLLQYNGTAWVNVTPAVTEPSIGAGSKNHINVVSLNSDWRINNDVITQDMLELTSPINPSDAATKSYTDTTVGMAITAAVLEDLDQTGGIATTAYVREDSGPTIGTYIDDHLDVPNYIAKLDSDKRISASSLPVAGISMRNLKYSDRDKENTGRNIIRTMHTDGTSVGDFVWSTYTAVNPLASGTIVHTDEYSYMQTEENQYGSIGRLRHCDVGYSAVNTDLEVDDCPKVFKAIVKYDGSANDSTVVNVGFHATHGQLSDLLACFDCFGTTNWWMRITMGYTDTPTDRGVAGGNYENVVYYVDSGIPVNEFRHLAIKVVKGGKPLDAFVNPGPDGIYFYELTPNVLGGTGGYLDYVWTQKGSFLLPDAITTLYPAALPRCYIGLEIRQRNVGTNKASQKLYFKDITYQEYKAYADFAPIAHTHTLADLTQSAATNGQVPTWNNTALAWQPATPSGGPGGGVVDGNKGDIGVTGSGATWTINNSAVTYAKMQNVSGNRILGRLQGTGTGVVTEMICTAAAQNLIACADAVAMRSNLNLSALAVSNLGTADGSIAITSPTPTQVELAVANSAITYAKMQNISATDKLLGRSTAGAGVVEEIACTAAGRALLDDIDASAQRTTLGLGTLATLNTTGTASATHFLRGDGAWSDVSDVHTVVKNTTGSTITKGSVVYISGASGQTPTITKAIATSDPTSAQTLGIVAANIAHNATGSVQVLGVLTGLDTSAFADGDQLYLSAVTAGALTATKPVAPNHSVYVAVVAHSDPSVGKLFVRVQNGYELDEIHDVLIATPAAGQVLTYDSGSSLWKNQAPANAPAGTLTGTTLAAGVTASSLTSVGTLGSLVIAPTTGYIQTPYIEGNTTTGTLQISGNSDSFASLYLDANQYEEQVILHAGGTASSSANGARLTLVSSNINDYNEINLGIVNSSNNSFSNYISMTSDWAGSLGTIGIYTGTIEMFPDTGVTIYGNLVASSYILSSSGINAQIASYTLVEGDNGKIITMSNASPMTLTIPPLLAVGFNCTIIQLGAGQVTIGGAAVTKNSYQGNLKISGQHGSASIISYASNVYNIAGSLSA